MRGSDERDHNRLVRVMQPDEKTPKPFLITVKVPWEPYKVEHVGNETHTTYFAYIMPVINLEAYLMGVTHGAN